MPGSPADPGAPRRQPPAKPSESPTRQIRIPRRGNPPAPPRRDVHRPAQPGPPPQQPGPPPKRPPQQPSPPQNPPKHKLPPRQPRPTPKPPTPTAPPPAHPQTGN